MLQQQLRKLLELNTVSSKQNDDIIILIYQLYTNGAKNEQWL